MIKEKVDFLKQCDESEKYTIYDDGKVYNNYKEVFLSERLWKKLYKRVTLRLGKVEKCFTVHQIVAYKKFGGECLIGPKGQKEIDHKDGNPSNNDPDNIQLLTDVENIRKGKVPKLSKEQVIKIKELYLNGVTCRDISEKYKVTVGTIQRIISGKHWNGIGPNIKNTTFNKIDTIEKLKIYGLFISKKMTAKEIGDKYGISDKYVRKIVRNINI